jgi:hypothetical protein
MIKKYVPANAAEASIRAGTGRGMFQFVPFLWCMHDRVYQIEVRVHNAYETNTLSVQPARKAIACLAQHLQHEAHADAARRRLGLLQSVPGTASSRPAPVSTGSGSDAGPRPDPWRACIHHSRFLRLPRTTRHVRCCGTKVCRECNEDSCPLVESIARR